MHLLVKVSTKWDRLLYGLGTTRGYWELIGKMAPTDMAALLLAPKKLCSMFYLLNSSTLVSSDKSTFFHMFGESPTCEHQKAMAFFWPLFRKAQLYGVYGLKWFYGQILQSLLWSFAAPSRLSLVALLPLWLMPSLPDPWVLVGGRLFAGLLWCHSLKNVIMDLMVLRGMFKVSDIFYN
jgi:hypothetical protein